MTPTLYVLCGLALVLLAGLWGLGKLYPAKKPDAAESPWIDPWTAPGSPPSPWMTHEEMAAILAERDQKPVHWLDSESCQTLINERVALAEAKIGAVIDERIREVVAGVLLQGETEYVRRREFKALAGAYCRHSLDEGELKARVTSLMTGMLDARELRIMDEFRLLAAAERADEDLARLAAKAEAGNERLSQAARKRPQPVRKRRP